MPSDRDVVGVSSHIGTSPNGYITPQHPMLPQFDSNIQHKHEGLGKYYVQLLTPWINEPGSSTPQSQRAPIILSRIFPIFHMDPYLILRSILISSHSRLGLPRGLFPVGLTNSMAVALIAE